MPEKGNKNIPFYFPELLTVPTCMVCPLPAPYHCQLQISWPVPCPGWRKSLFGVAKAESEQRNLLQEPGMSPAGHCARNAPGSHPELQLLQTPLVSRFPQPSTHARAKCGCASPPQGCPQVLSPGSGRAGQRIPDLSMAKPPSCHPPARRTQQVKGWGQGNELCHPTVPSAELLHQLWSARRTNSTGEKWFGLSWTGQICLPRPGQRAAVEGKKTHLP